MKESIIAIDGPSGSGKSTLAELIAKKYDYKYLDTGAMYRMIALATIDENINIENEEELCNLLDNIEMKIENGKYFVNEKDVSKRIREVYITEISSKIATKQAVRKKLILMQREIARGNEVVIDGRDIGTVVFPSANIKFFVTASKEERALRRYKEYKKNNEDVSYKKILKDIEDRDTRDMNRKENPLRKAEDAILIDTTKLTLNDVLKDMSKIIDKNLK